MARTIVNGTGSVDTLALKNIYGAIYNLGNGADVFYGNNMEFIDVNGGNGADLMSIYKSTDVWLLGGANADHYRIEGGSYNLVTDNQGPSLVQLVDTIFGRVTLGNESDFVSIEGGRTTTVDTYGGADQIRISDPEKDLRINTGEGSDTVRINFNEMVSGKIDMGFIRLGDGADTVEVNAWAWSEPGQISAANIMLNLPDFDQQEGDRLLVNGRGLDQAIVDGGDVHFDTFGPQGQPTRITVAGPGWQQPDGIVNSYTFANGGSEGWG